MKKESCDFCKIVSGQNTAHKIWEDKNHVAFLSIYPNTRGVTVVIPKKHYTSYVFDLPQKVMVDLMNATKKVAKILDDYFGDVLRMGLVFEGFGVDHIHAKLFPLHGEGKIKTWKKLESQIDHYFSKYPGYISSHDAKREDDKILKDLAEKIRRSYD